MNEVADALESLTRRAIDLPPQYQIFLTIHQADYTAAYHTISRMQELDPANPAWLVLLVFVCLATGREEEGRSILQIALSAHPEWDNTCEPLARLRECIDKDEGNTGTMPAEEWLKNEIQRIIRTDLFSVGTLLQALGQGTVELFQRGDAEGSFDLVSKAKYCKRQGTWSGR